MGSLAPPKKKQKTIREQHKATKHKKTNKARLANRALTTPRSPRCRLAQTTKKQIKPNRKKDELHVRPQLIIHFCNKKKEKISKYQKKEKKKNNYISILRCSYC